MVLDPQTNFGRSGVTSSIASDDTTISVTDASVFSDASNGNFNVVIFDAAAGPSPSQVGAGSREIVTVTGTDTTNDELTVTRGAEGTGATALPDTSVVIEATTGGDFDAVDAALESVASFSGGTADHLTTQLGTSSNRQDVYGGAIDGQSETIGSARISPDPNADPQTVINNAPVGATIEFDKSVTHTLSSTLEVTTDNLNINALEVERADSTTLSKDAVIKIHNCSDVTLEDCYVDGNKSNNGGGVQDETENCITITNATNTTIRDCETVDAVNQCIISTSYDAGSSDAGPVENTKVEDCIVSGSGNGAVLFAGGGSNTSKAGVATNNDVRDFANEGIQAVDGYGKVKITENYIEGSTPGVVVESHINRNATDQSGVVIADNDIIVSDHGIEFSRNNLDQDNNRIVGNNIEFSGSGSRGIFIDSNHKANKLTIVGNTLEGTSADYNADALIGIRFNTANINDCTIGDNTFNSMRRAVYIRGTSIDITITGNQIRDVHDGIKLENHDGGTVVANKVEAAGGVGILWNVNDGTTRSGVDISHNIVRDSGQADIRTLEAFSGDTLDNYVVTDNRMPGTGSGLSDGGSAPTQKTVRDNLSW